MRALSITGVCLSPVMILAGVAIAFNFTKINYGGLVLAGVGIVLLAISLAGLQKSKKRTAKKRISK